MSNTGKLLYLEGLRGIAAIFVVLGHLRNMLWARMPEDISASVATVLPAPFPRMADIAVRALMPSATLCVWIFWVMSAVVLARGFHTLQTPAGGRKYLAAAALKRYFRLAVPVLQVVIISWLVLAAGWMKNHEMAAVSGKAEAHWLGQSYAFSADFWFAIRSALWDTFFAYDNATTYNNSLWTMEYELWGSMIIFAWLALAGNAGYSCILAGAAALACTIAGFGWAGTFFIGIVFSDLLVRPSGWHRVPARLKAMLCDSALAGVGAITLLLVLSGMRLNNPGGARDLVLSTGVVAVVLLNKPCQRFFAAKLPVFLGKISFGLYLIHVPVLLSAGAATFLLLRESGHLLAALSAATVAVALSLAAGWGVWLTGDRAGLRVARAISNTVFRYSRSEKS